MSVAGRSGPTPLAVAVAAIYSAQLSRAKAGGGAMAVVGTLQSVGIVVLLHGTGGTAAEESRATIVAGAALGVVAFLALNLLAQRFGALKSGGGLDYYGSLPIRPAAVVLGLSSGYVTFAIPGAVVTAAIGTALFDLPVTHGWMLVVTTVTCGITFSGIGALCGLMPSRPEIATLAGQLGFTLVLMLGVIPPASWPSVLRPVRAALPLTYDIDALASALTSTPGWPGIATRLAGSAAFGACCLAVAARSYRKALDQ
ncbi:ABC transporter permease [Actinomadura rudentiformis]|uniref:ABC transporter permease n=1 Tax=Actinomadura rudentiformis TaxID=359158 RepID=A0A6H9YZH1_9ACTN|nr:ABC transporter permease [Actinomadura rudentiformis]KAB2349684.1 ABC transporter permease [Actinomadura rudentiformis]